jgi:hypothetical protein
MQLPPQPVLEEPKRFRAVAHQDILRLLVMIEHHFVRESFPASWLIYIVQAWQSTCHE